MIELINLKDLPITKRTVLERQARVFQDLLPRSLFMTSYDLHHETNIPASQWDAFLDLPELQDYLKNKKRKYLKQSAEKAMFQLGQGNLTSSEVASLKNLIEKSGILDVEEQQHTVVLTRIPNKERGEQHGET